MGSVRRLVSPAGETPPEIGTIEDAGAGLSHIETWYERERQSLQDDIVQHLEGLNLPTGKEDAPPPTKDQIRAMHARQRAAVFAKEWPTLGPKLDRLLKNFANGTEIVPDEIDPELVPVESDGHDSDVFRLASLLWAVPVSKGYGRRLRFLIRDQRNDKLIGIFALGDPVFNLSARDKWIGWTVADRRRRLVNVMDAYVLGAVPPYNALLGGKLVASLVGSAEVGRVFADRYTDTTGQIDGKKKRAQLVLVTVTSALGRSSLYNRLRLSPQHSHEHQPRPLVEVVHVGSTQGYGHFQLSDELFFRLRDLLREEKHKYYKGHQFGDGPNWRMRVARVGLERVGLASELVRHGIEREVYAMPLATNCLEFLRGKARTPLLERPTMRVLADAATDRWVLPRAQRDRGYLAFKVSDLRAQFLSWAAEIGEIAEASA